MSEMSTVSLTKSSAPPPLPPSFQEPKLLPKPRRCSAGAGIVWFRKAFEMFTQHIGIWLGMTLAMLASVVVISSVPLLGILSGLLTIFFIGGFMQAAARQARGERLKFDYLFSAFSTHLKPLLILSLLYIVSIIALFVVLLFGAHLLSAGTLLDPPPISTDAQIPWPFALNVYLIFMGVMMVGFGMMFWFALTLIVLHDVLPFKAMKMSFKAGIKNWLAFLILGVIGGLFILILTPLTYGLGLLFIMPIMLLMYYTSYRDIWTDQPLSVDR